MTDRVFIEGLRILAAHGVQEKEHREPQEFLLDISVVFDAAPASVSDKIADTVNYNYLREIALRVFAGPSRYLIERLASQIAAEILLDPRIHETSVTIRKTKLYPDCAAGLSITRSRPFPL